MEKFKELQMEETRTLGDGVRSATLLTVTGATGTRSTTYHGPIGGCCCGFSQIPISEGGVWIGEGSAPVLEITWPAR